MSTDIDWQHELDSSFGTGNDVEVARYIAAGHRAVRRRRLAALGAGLGAAAVIAGVAWTTAPGGTSRTSDLPVATPSPTESPRTTSAGINEGTVKSHSSRGLAALEAVLAPHR